MNRQSESSLGSRVLLFLTPAVVAYMLLLLSPTFDWRQRLLAAWCIGAAVFLAHAMFAFGRLTADEVRRQCQRQKTGINALALAGSVLIAVVSIGAVVYLLTDVRASSLHYRLHLALSLATIVLSLMSLQTLFAISYARMYYETTGGADIAGGLRFASVEPPDYWDFVYFSFSLAMCYGVTDVAVTSKHIRRVTLLQTLLSFFYYTVIIGLVMTTIGALF